MKNKSSFQTRVDTRIAVHARKVLAEKAREKGGLARQTIDKLKTRWMLEILVECALESICAAPVGEFGYRVLDDLEYPVVEQDDGSVAGWAVLTRDGTRSVQGVGATRTEGLRDALERGADPVGVPWPVNTSQLAIATFLLNR